MRRTLITLSLLSLCGLIAAPTLASGKDGKDGKGKTDKPVQTPPKKPAEKKPVEKKLEPKSKEVKKIVVGVEADAAITVTDTTGKSQTLKDYRGKITVIDFWSLDPASQAYDKKLSDLIATYSAKGVAFLAIDSSASDLDSGGEIYKRIVEYAKKAGLTFPIGVDKGMAVADKFGVTQTPDVFVLDTYGVVRYMGAIDDDPKGEKGDKARAYLKNALEAMIAGKEVPVSTTGSGGSTIKRAPKPADAPKKP